MSPSYRNSKLISVLICLGVYVIAFSVAYFSMNYFQYNYNLLVTTFFADVIATTIVFIFSLIFRNASLYDPYWSVAPVLIVAYWCIKASPEITFVNWLFLFVTFLWSIRLTLNWIRGWKGLNHEDWRYIQLRNQNPKIYQFINFAGIHLFPTIIVFTCLIPFYCAIKDRWNDVNVLIVCGSVFCLISIIISLIADEQMFEFRKKNFGNESMQSGLWKYSRHPNYLGEILFWWGGWLMAFGIDFDFYWTAFGPIALTCMFIFISIPMMEKRNLEKRKNYSEIIRKIPMLLPKINFN